MSTKYGTRRTLYLKSFELRAVSIDDRAQNLPLSNGDRKRLEGEIARDYRELCQEYIDMASKIMERRLALPAKIRAAGITARRNVEDERVKENIESQTTKLTKHIVDKHGRWGQICYLFQAGL